MAGPTSVRERISPGITASLFANYRSSADAVMELVDNSFDSRLAGQPLRVELSIQRTTLSVTTVGGAGMGPAEFQRDYLNWGGSSKRRARKEVLGRYGQGGKAAVGFLGSGFNIEASRPGEEVSWRIRDPDYRRREQLKTYAVERVPKRFAAGQGYVRVRIEGVDKRIDERRLAQRLADTYRPLLEAGQFVISLNGHELRPPPLQVDDRRRFRVRAAGATVEGWYGLREAPSPDAGLRCYRFGRLIAAGEFFGHPLPAQVPGLGRLVGEVEIPAVVALTMNKTDFDRDGRAWTEIEERLHKVLASIVRRLRREAEPPPSPSALRSAAQARRLLSQALRLMESGELFPGFEQARGGRPPGSTAGQESLPLPEADGSGDAEAPRPRAPEPPAGAGPRRRRGFGDIVIRPLDPAIRSQVIVEEGVRKVVINSRYPLYVERRGDTWYQLVTAAREICKAADPESVADFERRVNEILLAAFRLSKRTRRPQAGKQLPLLG